MNVVVERFDLGIGIMFTNAAYNDNGRDRMMFSVASIWDGMKSGSSSAAPACSACSRLPTRS